MSRYLTAAALLFPTYTGYLRSETWRAKREAVRKRAKRRCENCGRREQLRLAAWQVHHLHYPKVWGTEPLEDLILLCPDCHAEKHGKAKV